MKYAKQLSQLCTPAFFYFAISAFVYVLAILQNVGKEDGEFCLGSLSCAVPSTVLVFVIKALYVVFWTWVLNLMCKDGYPNIAWVMVLFPFIVMFLGMLFLNKNSTGFLTGKVRKLHTVVSSGRGIVKERAQDYKENNPQSRFVG